MNESRRVAASREKDRARQDKWMRKDEGMTGKEMDESDGGKRKKERGRTVSLKPNGCNGAWDEFRSGTERKEKDGTTIRSPPLPSPSAEYPLFTRSPLYSFLPRRFVALIINILPSPRLTPAPPQVLTVSSSFFFFPWSSSFSCYRPTHPVECTVPIINSNLCRTLFFIPSPFRAVTSPESHARNNSLM